MKTGAIRNIALAALASCALAAAGCTPSQGVSSGFTALPGATYVPAGTQGAPNQVVVRSEKELNAIDNDRNYNPHANDTDNWRYGAHYGWGYGSPYYGGYWGSSPYWGGGPWGSHYHSGCTGGRCR